MAIRILWDEYEAAILLDACLAVIDNRISRADAVIKVSEKLREKAIKNGYTIDSVFRNENGISMQMSIMIALIFETSSGLHGASKMFIDIVQLYKNNPDKFQKILEEAKKGAKVNIAGVGAGVSDGGGDLYEEEFTGVNFERYKKILSTEYKKGFRINDKLSVTRFRMQWKRTFEDELQYDDETICRHIAHITIQHGNMVYLPEDMLDENTKHRLLAYISTLFSEGKSVIYYEALYREFADDFAVGRINNLEMLRSYLSYINDGSMYFYRSYIASNSNVEVNNTDEVRSFLI